jgi:hypothetical protein
VIDRGAPYQGTLRALGTVPNVPQLPVVWHVANDSPNPLPTGLTLQANSDQGASATISGSTTALLTNYQVKVSATDNIGNPASVVLSLNTTSSLHVTTTSLPVGIVAVGYSAQLSASGYNTPFTWSVVSGALPYTLSSAGALSGTTNSAFNAGITFQVTDSLGDTAQATIPLVVSASTLQITTGSPLPQGTAGVAYTAPLAATGGVAPYTWSISPSSANPLPSGLSPSGATITGTTTAVGTTSFTIRVTDNIGSYVEKVFSLTIISGLTLKTGIDYTGNISTSYLGYIDAGSTDSISPRPNYSFYVFATGVITTSASTLLAGITLSNGSYTASVDYLSGHIAHIKISGPFASGSIGDNTLTVTVADSGVSASGTFKWRVYNNGNLRATASNAFPTQLVSA